MARTATFKASERFVSPTGLVPSSSSASAEGEEEGQAPEGTEPQTPVTSEADETAETAETDGSSEPSSQEPSESSEEHVETPSEPGAAEESNSEPAYPEGSPDHTWRVGQIDAWAAAQVPAVEFASGSTKNQKLEAIKGLSTTSEG